MGIDTPLENFNSLILPIRGNEEKPEWALTPKSSHPCFDFIGEVEMKRSPNGH